MNQSLSIAEDHHGPIVEVVGDWTADAAREFRDLGIDGLTLNYAKGFRERSLDFLRGMPIRRLFVLARTLRDIEGLYELPHLTWLRLQVSDRASLDLSRVAGGRLKRLSADWDLAGPSIAQISELETLFLGDYTPPDLTPLDHLRRLTELRLKPAPGLVTLVGLEKLAYLTNLEVVLAPGLADLSPVSALGSLRRLHIENCKQVSDLAPLADLLSLRELAIANSGEIESLLPLRGLANLELFWAWDSTRVMDNDLSPLSSLPSLTEIRMMDRRTYVPRVAEIKQLIGQED